MPSLTLQDIPEGLYRRIEELAARDHVPVEEETVRLLRQAVDLPKIASRDQVHSILETLRRNAITPAPGTPDSVEMLREDRER